MRIHWLSFKPTSLAAPRETIRSKRTRRRSVPCVESVEPRYLMSYAFLFEPRSARGCQYESGCIRRRPVISQQPAHL